MLCTDIVYSQEINTEKGNKNLYLKTNTLGLGAGIVNIAAEIDIAQHWSFSFPCYFSAWDYFKTTIKFRTLSIQPEFRYWIKEDNSGFFTSIHFGLSYFNFAFNGQFRYQDHYQKTPAIGGGLNLGYRVPISKNNRWNLEISLGGGCYKVHYDIFQNTPNTKDGLLIKSINKTYWGLDQAALSVSYAFKINNKGDRK